MFTIRFSQWTCAIAAVVLTLCASSRPARCDLWDWRDVDGKNYMTPAKAQGYWECRQFAGIAAFEAKIKIVLDRPDLDIDLSERHVIESMPGRSGFAQFTGETGRGVGVLTEAEMPYDMDPVIFATDWEDRAYSITDFESVIIYDEEALRETIQGWLRQYGPLYVQSFHGNTLVGYDDDQQVWIVKETGGPDIGDNGYFYYDYGFMHEKYVEILTGDVLIPEPASAVVLLIGLPWVLSRRAEVR